MAEKATILIPDISGFTAFTSITEIDHASHIISELLEIIVASNTLGFTIAEIEGDAVLFYLKGDSPGIQKLEAQSLEMFRHFHSRLKVIERDTVCQCGACQHATHLTLKFVIHYGEIKEIKVAHFIKATGIDMIVAHRLLKNSLPSDEYILITQSCMDGNADALSSENLTWSTGQEEYSSIGQVQFAYAPLSDFKKTIPPPRALDEFVIVTGKDNLEMNIDRALMDVYQLLINVDLRKDWMLGVDQINRDPVTERIGMKHNCQFMGLTMVNTCLHHSFTPEKAVYVEQVEVSEMALDTVDIYTLTSVDPGMTHLHFNINWKETPLPDETKQGMIQAIKANLESFKRFAENLP